MNAPDAIDYADLLRRLQGILPQPVRGEMHHSGDVLLIGGDPGEVIVRISGRKLTIAMFSVRWTRPYELELRPKSVATLYWKRLPASATMLSLPRLIDAAVATRRASYLKCEKCGVTKPPEWMHNSIICQSCAQLHLGVVY